MRDCEYNINIDFTFPCLESQTIYHAGMGLPCSNLRPSSRVLSFALGLFRHLIDQKLQLICVGPHMFRRIPRQINVDLHLGRYSLEVPGQVVTEKPLVE
jgi:hypothetical protein